MCFGENSALVRLNFSYADCTDDLVESYSENNCYLRVRDYFS